MLMLVSVVVTFTPHGTSSALRSPHASRTNELHVKAYCTHAGRHYWVSVASSPVPASGVDTINGEHLPRKRVKNTIKTPISVALIYFTNHVKFATDSGELSCVEDN